MIGSGYQEGTERPARLTPMQGRPIFLDKGGAERPEGIVRRRGSSVEDGVQAQRVLGSLKSSQDLRHDQTLSYGAFSSLT